MTRNPWSLPLYRAFGIRVRVHLFLLAYALAELGRAWFHKPAVPGLVSAVAVAMLVLFVSVLLHEYGHCVAARRMGGGAEEILLWPLGGLAMVDAPRTPRAQFWTSFGGPVVNLLLVLVLGGWLAAHGHVRASDLMDWQPSWVLNAFRLNLALLFFNLLPAFPMDGGQMLRAALWGRMGFGPATLVSIRVGKVAAVLMGIAGLVFSQGLLLAVAVMNFLACEQERLLLEAGAIGEETPSYGGWEPEEAPAGWLARRREARRERGAQERRTREARLRARMDAVLEKISLVGMQGLTREERAVLKEASDMLKHSRR